MGKAYIVRQKFTCEGKPDFWRTCTASASSPSSALDNVINGGYHKIIFSPGDWTNYKNVKHYEVWEDSFNPSRVRDITRATMASLEGCRKLLTSVSGSVAEHSRFWVVKAPELSVNSDMPSADLSGEQIAEKARPEEVVYEYRRVRAPTLEEALKRAGFQNYSSGDDTVCRWYDTGSSAGTRTLAASEKYPWQVFSDTANSAYARSDISDLSPIADLAGPGADNWERRVPASTLTQPAASTQAIAPPPNIMRLWIVAEERVTHDGACVANNATCWVVNLVQAIDETNAIHGANESSRAGLHKHLTYAPLYQGRTGNFIENGRMIAVQVDDSWAKYEGRTHEAQEPLREFARTCRAFIDAGVDDKLHERSTQPTQPTAAASTTAVVTTPLTINQSDLATSKTSTKETTMSKLTETLKTFANQTRDDASQGAKIAAGIKATKFLQRIITTRVVPNLPSFVEGYATEAVNSVYGGAVVSFLGGVALPHITTRFLDDKPQEFVEQTAKTMREQAFAGVFVELADLVGDELAEFFTREQRAAEREARRAEREAAQLQERTGVRAEDLFEPTTSSNHTEEKAELRASVFSGNNGRANGTSHSS